jgi:hypothetical protein
VYLLISYNSQNEQRFYSATALKAIETEGIKAFLCGKNSVFKYLLVRFVLQRNAYFCRKSSDVESSEVLSTNVQSFI